VDEKIIPKLIKTIIHVVEEAGPPKPSDGDIDRLLNIIAAELGLSIRFNTLLEDELIRITFGNVEKEALFYPELLMRFKEEYPTIQVGWDEYVKERGDDDGSTGESGGDDEEGVG
jgi:hypothetical protein